MENNRVKRIAKILKPFNLYTLSAPEYQHPVSIMKLCILFPLENYRIPTGTFISVKPPEQFRGMMQVLQRKSYNCMKNVIKNVFGSQTWAQRHLEKQQ